MLHFNDCHHTKGSPAPRPIWSRAKEVRMEFRCPHCEALLHSRRSRLCGICGAAIPEEQRLTDEQALLRDQELEQERADAQRLADVFSFNSSASQQKPRGQKNLSAAELIARAETGDPSIGGDYADQFKHRKRKGYWFYFICVGLLMSPIVWIASHFDRLTPAAWLAMIGITGIAAWACWSEGAPICPHCHKNIRVCPPAHCHICGDELHDKACLTCDVDYSWKRLLRSPNRGFGAWIAFCPGCGVHLDTSIKRAESRRSYSGGCG